ncbi:MAG: hypothetical protein IJS90_03530 [Clostridia bacterium]|nr:hypothetical protein [Clostridia bacterium]
MDTELFFVFFTLPILSAVLFVVFISLWFYAKNKNARSPEKADEKKQDLFKTLSKVFGIFSAVTCLLGVGTYLLLILAVNHM